MRFWGEFIEFDGDAVLFDKRVAVRYGDSDNEIDIR